MIRLGMCSVAFRGLTAPAIVELAADVGIEGIEWGNDLHVRTPSDAATVARACADAGIACPSLGSYLRAGALHPGEAAAVLDTAVALGATNVRVWCDWTGPDVDAATWGRVVADLQHIARSADERGLTASLECHDFTITERAASTVRLLADVAADNLYSYWQPVAGLGVERWQAELDLVAEHLSHLHVFWWADLETRLALADGAALWPDVLTQARTDGRWGLPRYAFIEFVRGDKVEQFRADAATLRGWLTDA